MLFSSSATTSSSTLSPAPSTTVTVEPSPQSFASLAATAIVPSVRSSSDPSAASSLATAPIASRSPVDRNDGVPSIVTDSLRNGTTALTSSIASRSATKAWSMVPPSLLIR